MTVDRTTIPPNTVVECGTPGHWKTPHPYDDCWQVTRTYAPIPEGLTPEEAEHILTDRAQPPVSAAPDPDAPLVEAMARAVLDNFSDTPHGYRLNATGAARDALAIVRASEATA